MNNYRYCSSDIKFSGLDNLCLLDSILFSDNDKKDLVGFGQLQYTITNVFCQSFTKFIDIRTILNAVCVY